MSIRGHHDWAFRRPSMFSAAYNTAGETEAANCNDVLDRYNVVVVAANEKDASEIIALRWRHFSSSFSLIQIHHCSYYYYYCYLNYLQMIFSSFFCRSNLKEVDPLNMTTKPSKTAVAKTKNNWIQLCFRAKKDLPRDQPDPLSPESVVFEINE